MTEDPTPYGTGTIAKKVLRFDPSPSPDVVAYEIQYRPVGSGIPFDSVKVTAKSPPEYIIPDDMPALALDGDFEIRILAVDDFGHRSAPGPTAVISLDFIPPDPPGAPYLGDYSGG